VLHRLLDPDPKKRLCATRGLDELKECSWFEGFDWGALENGSLLPPEQSFSFDLHETAAATQPAGALDHSAFADF
jgi:hypothetical protein